MIFFFFTQDTFSEQEILLMLESNISTECNCGRVIPSTVHGPLYPRSTLPYALVICLKAAVF